MWAWVLDLDGSCGTRISYLELRTYNTYERTRMKRVEVAATRSHCVTQTRNQGLALVSNPSEECHHGRARLDPERRLKHWCHDAGCRMQPACMHAISFRKEGVVQASSLSIRDD